MDTQPVQFLLWPNITIALSMGAGCSTFLSLIKSKMEAMFNSLTVELEPLSNPLNSKFDLDLLV